MKHNTIDKEKTQDKQMQGTKQKTIKRDRDQTNF